MDKLEKFQVSNLYGEYVKKSISDCIKEFEYELERTGLTKSLIGENESIRILAAYINSESEFLNILEDCKHNLQKIMPTLKKTQLNHISMGILKTTIIKYHYKLFSRELAINLAIEVFHQAIHCMEIRNNFNYIDLENDDSFAIKGANARHKENRDYKKDVFKWLDENMHSYKSMDDAAFTIAEKLVPMKFRTVRQWLTEWKKLRSAGRA